MFPEKYGNMPPFLLLLAGRVDRMAGPPAAILGHGIALRLEVR